MIETLLAPYEEQLQQADCGAARVGRPALVRLEAMAPVNSASVIQTHPPAKLADTTGISLTCREECEYARVLRLLASTDSRRLAGGAAERRMLGRLPAPHVPSHPTSGTRQSPVHAA